LSEDAYFESVIVDGTIVRVDQHGTGARGDPQSGHRPVARRLDDQDRRPGRCARQPRALRPAAGATTRHVGVAPLLKDLDFAALLADKAFDSDGIRAELDDRGAVAVIPPKANRAVSIPCDFERYKWRHLVENFFCKIKEFRRIATRYDKTDTSFSAMIHLVGIVLAVRCPGCPMNVNRP
jgi:transposase